MMAAVAIVTVVAVVIAVAVRIPGMARVGPAGPPPGVADDDDFLLDALDGGDPGCRSPVRRAAFEVAEREPAHEGLAGAAVVEDHHHDPFVDDVHDPEALSLLYPVSIEPQIGSGDAVFPHGLVEGFLHLVDPGRGRRVGEAVFQIRDHLVRAGEREQELFLLGVGLDPAGASRAARAGTVVPAQDIIFRCV